MSTNVSEISNTPISITINGKEIKVRRLSAGEYFSFGETKIKEKYLKNMQEIAGFLSDTKEKIQYLREATKDIPSGDALTTATNEYFQTPEGMISLLTFALNKCQKIDQSELENLITTAKQEEIQLIFSYIMGIDLNKTEDVEKKTTATTIT